MKTRRIIAAMTAAAAIFSFMQALAAPTLTKEKYPFGYLEREMEYLDRGLVAMKTDDGIYLSWRLMSDEDAIFGSADENVTFKIYRNGAEIDEVTDTTNYTDTDGNINSVYKVESSSGDVSGEVTAFESGKNYFDIPLTRPAASAYGEYTINDTSVGDLDGDGEYELVVKWDSNGKDNSQSGTTGEVLLDAYKLDGTRLWDNPINLGKNIRSGAHYTQFLVYDFDGDGKAELTCKTAPGSKDANGAYVSAVSLDEDIKSCDNNADYRNSGGYILTGDEYFTVFDGETGAAIDTIYYPNQRLAAAVWGDTYGNRLDRFTAAVAYVDGETPYAVYMRGYYMGEGSERQAACAISFNGERLSCTHSFDTYDVNNYKGKTSSSSYKSDGTYKGVDGYAAENAKYVGEGNHNCTVADVDGDGKDEVLTGALCYGFNNDKLTVEWCTFLEHGDALHIGDYDPLHGGYEFFTVHEDGGVNKFSSTVLDYGMSVIDAATGTVMYHRGASGDTGRGMMANVGAGGYYQFWGAGSYKALGNDRFEAATVNGASTNFRIFWDGDLYDELMDGQIGRPLTVTAWNGKAMSAIFTTDGCTSVNGTKANPSLQADILGDWREEIVMARNDNQALRVFVSDIPTEYKMMTLMHDSVYRSGVAAEQSGYNQPPHIGFYLGETSFSGPVTSLTITSDPAKTSYYINDALDTTGLAVSVVYENGKSVETKDFNVTGFNPKAAGEQEVTVEYEGVTDTFEVEVVTGFSINNEGLITGYESTGETVIILPESIDGKDVTGFADNALSDADISNIYIYADDLTFGENVFGGGITVHAPEGSAAEEYCADNNIPFVSTSVVYSYMADVSYEDSAYSSYIGNYMVIQSQPNVDKVSLEGITYANNPRNDAYPDATTGIRVGKEGSNTYLVPVAGEFSTGGRNAWMEVDEKIDLNTVSEYTLKFDIMYPTDCGTLLLTLTNGTRTIDAVEMTADLQTDTWYTYTYSYDKDKNLTKTISQGNTVLEEKSLGSRTEDIYCVNHIEFTRDDSGPNPSTLWGGWGNHGLGRCALAYMDNIQVFTPERSKAKFTITDRYGSAVEGAAVTMAGMTVLTDENGEASIAAENGEYEAQISASGYVNQTENVLLYDGVTPVNITMSDDYSIRFRKDSLKIKVGEAVLLEYTVMPTEKGFTEFTSSNPSVAAVNENGILRAVGAGSADITVKNGSLTDTLTVTVTENSENVPSSIVLSGETSYRAGSFLAPYMGKITAEVYDTDGVLLDTPVTFTASDGALLSSGDSGTMFAVDTNAKSFTVTASCGNVTKTQRINITQAKDYANASFDDSARILQGRTAQSETLDGTGITLHVGNRDGGGDSYTGFVMDDGVLTAQAGQYNTAARNAYITLDSAPALNKTDEYMLKTKIKFNSGTSDATVTIGDGTVAAVSLTPDSGFNKNVWYDYVLDIKNGEATQIIHNTATDETVTSTYTCEATKLSRIDITNADGKNSSVSFDGILLTSSDKILASAIVTVMDENGDYIEGAAVKSSLDGAVTKANGKARISAFAGANKIYVTAAGKTKEVTALINDAYTPVSVKLSDEKTEIIRIDGDIPVYYVVNCEDNAIQLIQAGYDGNYLKRAERRALINGKGAAAFKAFDEADVKLFIWDINMKPLMAAR